MTEDEQMAQHIVDGARYQIQAGTADANWSLIERQQWISLESLKVAIAAALRAQREAWADERTRLQNEVNDVRAAAEAYQQRINAGIVVLRGEKQ